MSTITFISGMERFNAHVWDEVRAALAATGVRADIRRFHDGHVDARDPALTAAIRAADVVFISLINGREHADWLAAELAEAPARAVFAFESMPEVMALTKVGEYRISGGKGGGMPGPMKAVMRLITRGRDEDALYAYTKLTKLTARLLPLMPDKLKDFRTWLSVNIYWNQPDAANLTQMVRLILRDCLDARLDVAAPQLIPTMGCFHPDAPQLFGSIAEFWRWRDRLASTSSANGLSELVKAERSPRASAASAAPERAARAQPPRAPASSPRASAAPRPLVALLAFRKHVVQRQAYLGELIRALEDAGMDVLPVFVSGIEAHVAVREWLTPQHLGGRKLDLLLSTMGFPLVGGPAGSTKPGQHHQIASDLLAGLDVPYMIAQPLQMQDTANWQRQGVAPMQAVIMYDLPELDGSLAPVAIGAISGEQIVAAPDRLARVAAQAAGWTRLRQTAARTRRLGLILYNFPPGLGKLGTAALLDVPASLHNVLTRLAADGYDLGGPVPDRAALTALISASDGSEGGQHVRVSLAEYRRMIPPEQQDEIDAKWGAAPGEIAPAGRDAIRLDGFALGNVFVAVQPPMGVPGDPMRLLFDHSFTPHHQYAAFYAWLAQGWQADALVHIGMHGTAEWMPGLQLGLTGACWPDRLLGALPNIYLYPLNNPSEALIARRRGYAAVVSHLVPPYARAGRYKQLAHLRAGLTGDGAGGQTDAAGNDDRGTDAAGNDDRGTDAARCVPTVRDGIAEIPELPRHIGEAGGAYRARALAYLDELERRLILDGLHIFGALPDPARAQTLIEAALDVPRDGAPGLAQALGLAGVPPDQIVAARAAFVQEQILRPQGPQPSGGDPRQGPQPSGGDPRWSPGFIAQGRAILDGLAQSRELDALSHALRGGYIRPAVGADPVRAGAAALPSGRNIHAIDPWRLPTDAALRRGALLAEALLARHGGVPETVALTLWALDTIKTEGETLAVALHLLGARPERDGQGKIWRYALVPLAELGRPRVDLLLDISPIFRDTFQLTLDLLDAAFRAAAAADEPPEQNFVRAHALTLQAQGESWDAATARIFTQAPGQYGTGVDERIDEGQWDSAAELAETYVRRDAYTYGGTRAGAAAPAVLRGLLGTVRHVFQTVDSVEYGLTDMQHYYGHSGAIRLAAQQAQGGAAPALSYADTGGAPPDAAQAPALRSAEELLAIETRARLLNPRWFEPLLSHGFAGAAEIGQRFTYLLGWSATTGAVDGWVFDSMAQTFLLDNAVRERLEAANPTAARNAVARLLEANGRGLWQADESTIERLQTLYADLEDRLERV